MGSEARVKDLLAKYNINIKDFEDIDETSRIESAMDASAESVRRFVGSSVFDARMIDSFGEIHIEGSGVKGNAAPMANVGDVLSNIQASIDSIGAKLRGRINEKGRIPSEITSLTSLDIVASPMPGSLRILVSPGKRGFDEVYPDDGDNLFGIGEDFGKRPLADLSLEAMIDLIKEVDLNSPDSKNFEIKLQEMGPRVASSMKSMFSSFAKSDFDVEMSWKEPQKRISKARVNKELAAHAVRVIVQSKADIEKDIISGSIITVTTSTKDRIRILDESGEDILISIGDISRMDLARFHAGSRVLVGVEKSVSYFPGGRTTVKYRGVSIRESETLHTAE